MKFGRDLRCGGCAGPAPHGAGGLKCKFIISVICCMCPAPHGAGGLKYRECKTCLYLRSPAPHGAGGLKYVVNTAPV